MEMEMDIKIKITMRGKEKLLANATLQILTSGYGWISIKDFQIWSSTHYNNRLGEFINIAPPSMRFSGKYVSRVYFESPKSWEEIEKLIYNAFKSKRDESAPINID